MSFEHADNRPVLMDPKYPTPVKTWDCGGNDVGTVRIMEGQMSQKEINTMRTFEEGGSICRIISCVDNDRIYYKIETGNDTAHFSDLSEEEQKIVLEWLQWNVWLAKNKLDGHSSYGMKHILNNRTGIYITNNQMKEAMWNLGFRPTKINTLNWTFKIKKSSPIFQR